ncbi:endoribonuclease LACTB2 [Daktulosphaira vitifoliae]|uniref:endoribonuclease LACTB2 n=1 Tax=Daktulosphaira vitifoliae TaxID=58002 RepID=UPI0021A98675|nr:endoribonuclease LACTB2 [Daktulosphaira vitifoliae]
MLPIFTTRSQRFIKGSIFEYKSGRGCSRISKMFLPHIPPVSNVSSRVLRVLGCNPSLYTLQGSNTYIVGTGHSRILIDSGEPNIPEYIKNLKETMEKYKFKIEHIIVSHWHEDHIGGVKNILDMISNKNECKVWKLHPENEKLREYNFPINFMKDHQEFHTEGATLKIYHTPGHTTDHVVIFLDEEKALFSADCVLGEGTTIFENLEDYMKSLNLILQLNPAVIFPGHGSVIQNPIRHVNNYIRHRVEREKQIIQMLRDHPLQAMTKSDIVNKIYESIPKGLLKVADRGIEQHLIKLQKDGVVIKIDNVWKFNNSFSL